MTAAALKPTQYSLGLVDYVVFAAFMCISTGVGAYYAVVDKFKKKVDGPKPTTEEYLLGGRKMPYFPIALSLMATSLSGVTLLGTPAEIFDHGALWMLHYWVAPFSAILAAVVFLPIIYHLNTTSVYEYLELRFHSTLLRRLTAGAFVFNALVFMGVVIYAPAVALSGVTDMETWWLILLVGVTSTLYTTFGGMKAVVWTDTLQAGVMYIGIGFILVKGTMDAGGLGRIWEVAMESGRMATFNRLDPNPAQYMNVWALLFGSSLMWINFYGLDQMAVQRYCSVSSIKEARKVVWITIPFTTVLSTLACFIGLLVLAYFYNSNPMESGEITTYDQLVVLFAVKVSGPYLGLSGLFLACIFATTLSTVSSGYNSLAAVVYNDFLRPLYNDQLTPEKALKCSKITVFLAGFFSTCIAFAAGPLGGIIYASVGLTSATYGPVVGLFFLGVFARDMSTKAATVSFFTAISCCVCLFVFSISEMPYKNYHLPTNHTLDTVVDLHYGTPDTPYLSRISPFFYGLIGFVLSTIPAILLSRVWPAGKEKYASGRRHSLTWHGRQKKTCVHSQTMNRYQLGWVDYVLFGAFMCISIGVGLYYAILERLRKPMDKEKATEEYLMGGRAMPSIPTVLSLVTTFMSGITLFGIPAEIYEHGAVLMVQYLTMPLAILLLGYVFIPIFHNLGSTSIFEYLEIRFHSVFLRRLCAAMFVVNTLMLMGVVIYAPAVALSGVTTLDTWILILLVGVSSSVYTTFGGLKAVVWTDALQAGVMYIGMAIIIIKGTIDAGGVGKIWEVAVDSERIKKMWRIDPNPAQYMSIWITLADSLLTWLSFYGLNQMALQRYCAVPSLKEARRIVKMTAPMYALFSAIVWYTGFTVLAYFYNCNPLETGEVKKYDQLMVLFAVKVTENLPGLPGLFLACIFATTLSTISSGYNSMTAVVYEDFVNPLFGHKLTSTTSMILNKALVCLFGCVSIGISFACGHLGGIIMSVIGMFNATSGPTLGIFIVGILSRKVSTKATTIGFVFSSVVCLTLWSSSVVERPYAEYHLATNSSLEGCDYHPFNLTHTPAYDAHYGRPDSSYISRISPFLYPPIGVLCVWIPAIVFSFVFKPKEEQYSAGRKHSLTFRCRPKKISAS